jgi:xylan 1,4-beta-xylosidase
MMSYWTFSDVFEEGGVVNTPFYGGFGLIAAGQIPKASFNVFRLLHQLGDQRIPNDSDFLLVTRRADGALAIAAWNYSEPEDAGSSRQLRLDLRGVKGGRTLWVTVVDGQHGSPLAAWEAMGKPSFPSREQQEKLRAAGALPATELRSWKPGAMLELTLAPKALVLIDVPRT